VGDGFGYTVTFYSGFSLVAGGLTAVLVIEKLGREFMIVWGFLGQIVLMWVLSISFYWEIIP
jgi:hypothetical protein